MYIPFTRDLLRRRGRTAAVFATRKLYVYTYEMSLALAAAAAAATASAVRAHTHVHTTLSHTGYILYQCICRR